MPPVFLEALCLKSGEVCDSVERGKGAQPKQCPLLPKCSGKLSKQATKQLIPADFVPHQHLGTEL